MSSRTFVVRYIDGAGGVSGAGPTSSISIQRLNDLFFYNFTASTWAQAVSPTDGNAPLTEVAGGPRPGLYQRVLDTTAFVGGVYRADIELSLTGHPTQYFSVEFDVAGGVVMTVYPAPPPGVGAYCNVYTYVRNQDDMTIPEVVVATALITELPYSYNGAMHVGDKVSGNYDPLTGLLQWNIVQGAKVQFDCDKLGLVGSVAVVPLNSQVELAALFAAV